MLVAGGGIAGMAAAVGLAERGVPVIMVEPYPQLGGRVRAWPVQHGADAVTMSRGFHAFFRQYYNLRGLLRRIDPGLRRLTPLTDYPLVLAGGHTDSFARIPRTPPLNMAAFVAQSPSFRLRDLAAVDVPAAMELLDVDFPDTFSAYDGESADQFLDRLRFPDGARHLALEVFARSFFAHPKDFSAGELVAMFHAYFLGSSEGLLFDVPDDDYETAFWGPLRHYLAGLGVELRLGERVTRSQRADRRGPGHAGFGAGDLGRGSGGRHGSADHPRPVARAAAWATTHGGIGSRRCGPPRRSRSGGSGWTGSSIRRGRRSSARPGSDRWTTSRCSSGSRTGPGAGRVRTAGRWSNCTRTRWSTNPTSATLKERLRSELHRIYPELTDASVLAEEWLVSADCPLAGTGPWRDRLTVHTPDPRIVLAGDGIRCDYPVALMERAATTGFLAANQLLADRGLSGHDLWTVPMRSRNRVSAPLHRLLTHS